MIMTCNLPTWSHRQIFWRCFVSHLKSGYWSKFDVNIITGSGVMAIFFCKGLTRNTEIENTPVWALPNIWRLGRVRHTNVINEIWLNTAKYPGYSFHYFWVIKGKPTMKQGGGDKTNYPPQIRIKLWRSLQYILDSNARVGFWRTNF